ncbi:hypothetical protein CF85_gp06 [Oenococcus phage phiS13]|uniref:Uncharacterized protein n=1 Tax=Oenococcus phage phiS13 TaxID=1432848 RepID=V5UTJ4_9CAUD|nr:hypothetical protein [Oenococcus oeni]YP_009005259.1 hypothetical protein CF85_gp06 [Oenococcus phage phiS13]AHB80409.1 hypothetical protein [Oenococcus phage phiS13]
MTINFNQFIKEYIKTIGYNTKRSVSLNIINAKHFKGFEDNKEMLNQLRAAEDKGYIVLTKVAPNDVAYYESHEYTPYYFNMQITDKLIEDIKENKLG